MSSDHKSCDAIKGKEADKIFKCRRCGKKHGKKNCPAYKTTCNICDKTGHLPECCFKNNENEKQPTGKVNSSKGKTKKTAAVIAESEDSDDTDTSEEHVDLHLHAVSAEDTDGGDWYEDVIVGTTKIKFKLDCGAQCNVLPLQLAQEVKATLKKSSTKYIVSYNGQRNKVEGEFSMSSKVNGKLATLTYKVVDLDVIPVLGRKSCVQMNLIKRVEAVVNERDKTPPRLKRIILDVQPYAPKVVYVNGVDVPIADALSSDIENPVEKNEKELKVHIVLNVTPTWMEQILAETKKSTALEKLIHTINAGWPEKVTAIDPEVRPFWNFRDELSTHAGMVFKGDRIVLPEPLRRPVMEMTHAGHFGMQSCISRAKQLVFWPEMSRDIQQFVDDCGASR